MTNKDFARGIEILSKYMDPDGFEMAASHDLFIYGGADLPVTAAERAELLACHWHIEEDSWCAGV